jgi:hypothetical protein
MRSSASLTLLSAATLLAALAGDGTATVARAQSVPVQQAQTPQQADQTREKDRSRAQDVKLGQDWKAHHQGNAKHTAGTGMNKEHQTVGSNWRVRHDNQKP